MSSFSIFNLNIMHGRNRRSATFPPRLPRKEIQANLQKIADLVHERKPDIVTLQEVDESSMLSGSFNQFEWLAARLEYSHKYFAPSCSISFFGKPLFITGNAIFSRYPLENCESYKFDVTFPTDRMGFVIADAKLPEGKTVAVASVHLVYLDWLKRNSRETELQLLEKAIRARDGSAIVAGDFNCDYLGLEDSLRSFVERLNLRVYQANAKDMATTPSWGPTRRIDWVLGSKNVQFGDYRTLDAKISDHLPVFATITL